MKKQRKGPKKVSLEIRKVVAANIRTRMDQEFRGEANKPKRLAERVGIALATVQRSTDIHASTGISIDTLAQIAMGLRCDPVDLLRRPEKVKTPKE